MQEAWLQALRGAARPLPSVALTLRALSCCGLTSCPWEEAARGLVLTGSCWRTGAWRMRTLKAWGHRQSLGAAGPAAGRLASTPAGRLARPGAAAPVGLGLNACVVGGPGPCVLASCEAASHCLEGPVVSSVPPGTSAAPPVAGSARAQVRQPDGALGLLLPSGGQRAEGCPCGERTLQSCTPGRGVGRVLRRLSRRRGAAGL